MILLWFELCTLAIRLLTSFMVSCFCKDRHPSVCISIITLSIRERWKISYQCKSVCQSLQKSRDWNIWLQYSKKKKQLRLAHLSEVISYITVWKRETHNCLHRVKNPKDVFRQDKAIQWNSIPLQFFWYNQTHSIRSESPIQQCIIQYCMANLYRAASLMSGGAVPWATHRLNVPFAGNFNSEKCNSQYLHLFKENTWSRASSFLSCLCADIQHIQETSDREPMWYILDLLDILHMDHTNACIWSNTPQLHWISPVHMDHSCFGLAVLVQTTRNMLDLFQCIHLRTNQLYGAYSTGIILSLWTARVHKCTYLPGIFELLLAWHVESWNNVWSSFLCPEKVHVWKPPASVEIQTFVIPEY